MSGWRSNDWTAGPSVPRLGSRRDWDRTVAVIVPALGSPERLDAVLAALGRQTYPAALTRVVVVDDGSQPPLAPTAPAGLAVSVLRHAETNQGSSAARAAGVASVDTDVIAFLDSDMLAEPDWLEAHMRWHHVRERTLVVGFRRHVAQTAADAAEVASVGALRDLFAGQEFFEPDWFEDAWNRCENGLVDAHTLWRLTSAGNLSVDAEVYRASGGFDPGYANVWGGEDNDVGHRLYTSGALIVPDREAMAWHLGIGTSHDERTERLRDRSRRRLAARIPSDLLPQPAGLLRETPLATLELRADGHAGDAVVDTIDQTLAELGNQVAIVVAIDDDHPDADFVTSMTAVDPRVRTAGDPDTPTAWTHAFVCGWVAPGVWKPGALAKAVASLGEGRIALLDITDDGAPVGQLRLTRADRIATATGEPIDRHARRTSSAAEWAD